MFQYCSDAVCYDQHNAVKNKQVNRKDTHTDILPQNAADGRGSRDSDIRGAFCVPITDCETSSPKFCGVR